MPVDQGPAEVVDLGRTRVVLEVLSKLGDEGCPGLGVVDLVDVADFFFGKPALRVSAGCEGGE